NLNLNAISGTIVPVVGSSAETFANNFFANLFTRIGTWLADAANGLEKIFVREVRTQKLCIINDLGEETCVEREGLKNLLDGAVFAETEGGGEIGTEGEGEELPPGEEVPPEEDESETSSEPEPENSPESEPEPTEEDPETETTPEPEPEPETEPEITPEPESTPDPEPEPDPEPTEEAPEPEPEPATEPEPTPTENPTPDDSTPTPDP
ncbi:MAG: hypothetical protein PHX30_06605, partial [Candidatus Pacebacteria bacterium]|nr:hypothetical protein [Candidatus Paceibacterota bacterium]